MPFFVILISGTCLVYDKVLIFMYKGVIGSKIILIEMFLSGGFRVFLDVKDFLFFSKYIFYIDI
jgi:hypothetical protein